MDIVHAVCALLRPLQRTSTLQMGMHITTHMCYFRRDRSVVPSHKTCVSFLIHFIVKVVLIRFAVAALSS